ncbi:cytochrome c oxidase assembly protein [Lysinibacillus yapensis]|uniref:Cytochrome c oxidase assembly protein n=1 Tax=Ureibacillus yapensis TaxID=2304605 RepID=A0A396S3M9_9BACL|nr:cytochrome c oxidase assembly protein [Lysinibacillus yapensis]RHW32402.1 cytochrome c oxidase assembly protein [Lysinibacillus yapensis]
MHHHSDGNSTIIGSFAEMIIYVVPLIAIGLYLWAVYMTNKKYKKWPVSRVFFWIGGVCSAALAMVGPIAEMAHSNFQAHMLAHLLLGMLAPLLLVLSAPVTLLLRTVPVKAGRTISKLLRSSYGRWVTNPLNTAILNIGGLWLLYTTDLFQMMHESLLLYLFIHLHVFIAGYLFTLSILYIDPVAHQKSFQFRAFILIMAMAGHGILSKWIYANPPAGVKESEAQAGGMLMYYGGDMVDLMLVIILCYQYFKGNRRLSKKAAQVAN